MAIPTCTPHGVLATRRCPVCHKPLCSRCRAKDGCCSERCFKKRAGFWAPVGAGHRSRTSGAATALLFLIAAAAIGYGVARYLGYL